MTGALMHGTYCRACKQMTGITGHAPHCRVPERRNRGED